MLAVVPEYLPLVRLTTAIPGTYLTSGIEAAEGKLICGPIVGFAPRRLAAQPGCPQPRFKGPF